MLTYPSDSGAALHFQGCSLILPIFLLMTYSENYTQICFCLSQENLLLVLTEQGPFFTPSQKA